MKGHAHVSMSSSSAARQRSKVVLRAEPVHETALHQPVIGFARLALLLGGLLAAPALANDNYRSVGTAADYTTGTVSVTIGSAVVTGSGTTWQTANRGQGDKITISAVDHYVLSVDSETQLTLQSNYAGSTAAGLAYTLARPYGTVTAWEADREGDLVATTLREIAVLFADSTFDEHVVIDGSTTNASYYMTVTVATGNRHAGTAGGGVIFDTSTDGHVFQVDDDYVRVEWLEITGWRGGSAEAFRINGDECTFSHMVVHDNDSTWSSNTDADAFYLGTDNTTAHIHNCIMYNLDRVAVHIQSGSGRVANVRNCTVLRCLQEDGVPSQYGGIDGLSGNTINAHNTIVLDTGYSRPDFSGNGSWGSSDYNLSSDTSAPGGNSLLSKSSATQFVDSGSGTEDLHLVAGADAREAGTDLSAYFTDDIDTDARPLSALWDIGADEFRCSTCTVGPATAGACGGSDCDYQSIQSAIDSVTAGGTVTVYRRTDDAANNECYNEHVAIARPNLTIQGNSTTPASAACIGPSTGGDIVGISVSGVTLKNLHISGKANNGAGGTNAKGSGGRSAGHGIVIRGNDLDGVTVEKCTIDFNAHDNIRFDGDTDDDGDGYVVIKQCYVHHADSMRNIRIIGGGGSASDRHIVRNNLIHTGQGMLLSGPIDYATVDKNVIKGWPYWGHLDGGSYPEVRTGGFGGGWRYYSNCIAGVWVTATAPSELIIQNNLILGTRWGIRVNTTGTILNNTIINPFNASQYDHDGTIAASDIRDNTFGIMIADGFAGTIQNNLLAVTSDNRANGSPGQDSGTHYTPGITGYGIAFLDNTGTLGGGASISNNNAWGFFDTDGTTALNYGSGITASATNLSVDPQFASDTADESNSGSGPCLADGNDVGDTRCYELYEDNYFVSSTQTSGSCHASVLENTAGAPEFVDLSAGGTRDPDTGDHSGLDDCSAAADATNSRAIDFGTGAVGGEPEKNGDLANLGAFGCTTRASKSPTLRIVGIDVGSGGVKDSDTTFAGPGIIQPGADGITEVNVYFNRSVSASSSSFLIRDHCDTTDLTAPTFDFSGASVAPFVVQMTWPTDTFENQWIRIHALGDGVNRIVDDESAEALDGEVTDIEDGPIPSGNATDGGDCEFVIGALEGDTDGDAE